MQQSFFFSCWRASFLLLLSPLLRLLLLPVRQQQFTPQQQQLPPILSESVLTHQYEVITAPSAFEVGLSAALMMRWVCQ